MIKIIPNVLILINLIFIFSLSVPVWTWEPDYSKDPVVMVHGYLGGSYQWADMRQDLINKGWPPEYLFAIDYSDKVGCNEKNAEELKVFIEDVLKETGKEKVDIIAHSMGGLSARYYIKFLGGITRVNDYVSLGSPHQGTLASVFGILTCGAQQMIPGSDFLKKLNSEDPTPPPVKYTSIWSTGDEACIPNWECSYLPGARMEAVISVGHLMLMIDDIQVLPKVIEALNGGGKNDVVEGGQSQVGGGGGGRGKESGCSISGQANLYMLLSLIFIFLKRRTTGTKKVKRKRRIATTGELQPL